MDIPLPPPVITTTRPSAEKMLSILLLVSILTFYCSTMEVQSRLSAGNLYQVYAIVRNAGCMPTSHQEVEDSGK